MGPRTQVPVVDALMVVLIAVGFAVAVVTAG